MAGLLQDQVAIVTGAARGIGREIARVFAIEGCDVVLTDHDLDGAALAAAEISVESGRRAIAVETDVTRKTDVARLVQTTLSQLGAVQVLVNNAGIFGSESLFECSEERFDRIIDVNLKGTFLCTQAVAREMVKARYGRIINVSSCSAIAAYEGENAAYGASKAGVSALTRVYALELGRYGICVNAILPGLTVTNMAKESLLTPENEAAWIERTALKKLATPTDQANAALFLASRLSGHVTGEGIIVAGGEIMGQR